MSRPNSKYYDQVVKLRKEGKTYPQISQELGINADWAQAISGSVSIPHAPEIRNCNYSDQTHSNYFGIRHLPIAEFWSKIKIGNADECWPWTLGVSTDGYGRFQVKGHHSRFAHRFAYEYIKGPIPDGLEICHTCNTPLCCNPMHLYAGTQKQNMADRTVRYNKGELPPRQYAHGMRKPITHGTISGYGRNCRCQACKEAQSRYQKDRYKKNISNKIVPILDISLMHGTRNTYQKGCRCQKCREAEKIYQREYHKRRQNANQVQ